MCRRLRKDSEVWNHDRAATGVRGSALRPGVTTAAKARPLGDRGRRGPSTAAKTVGSVGARVLRVRGLVRFPIGLYRARLGFLFGSRLLLLEHMGRATGIRRCVVLEVVDHPSPTRYVVASGFGAASQWFLNIQADPHVRVSVARHHLVLAAAQQLSRAEAATTLATYSRRHRLAWAALEPVFEAALGAPTTELPLVALDLTLPAPHEHDQGEGGLSSP
jgi:deazaflavin-dependent oxidoreductase (nitroreductase family)